MVAFWERAAHSVYHMFYTVVKVAEWPPFGRELLIRFTICSLCFFYFFVFLVISHLGFEGGTLVLIASVPGRCLSFTFLPYKLICNIHCKKTWILCFRSDK